MTWSELLMVRLVDIRSQDSNADLSLDGFIPLSSDVLSPCNSYSRNVGPYKQPVKITVIHVMWGLTLVSAGLLLAIASANGRMTSIRG